MKTLTRAQQTVIFQKEIWKLIRRFGVEFDLQFIDVMGILELTKLDLYRMEVEKMKRDRKS